MKCPGCKADMEFEEIKNNHGQWWCDCGYEANGSRIPCDAEYFTDSGSPIPCDWEETIEEPQSDEDAKADYGDAEYHRQKEEGAD